MFRWTRRWCCGRPPNPRAAKAFAEAQHFAIHIIGAEQLDICERFARNGTAFEGLDWQLSENQVPLINNCLARFECTPHAAHDAGDHRIIVAQVQKADWRAGAPLVFSQGTYRQIVE